MNMRGEKLAKSAVKLIQTGREAHLTMEARGHLNRLRSECDDKRTALMKAERAYTAAVERGSPHTAQIANHRLSATKEAHSAAQVALAVAEKAMGVRD